MPKSATGCEIQQYSTLNVGHFVNTVSSLPHPHQGDPRAGHDVGPAALHSAGPRGEPALPAAASGDSHTLTHPPPQPGTAPGDGHLPGPPLAPGPLSPRGAGTFRPVVIEIIKR